MNQHEQKEHDAGVERFVDVTLAGARSVLAVMEADMKMVDSEIPAEDTSILFVGTLRVAMTRKLFEAYGATLLLNEHVRRVLMVEGRKEQNDDIDARLRRITEWMDRKQSSDPRLALYLAQMLGAARAAADIYKERRGF